MSSQNNNTTSGSRDHECNGGIGYHQPSHFVKVDTQVDGNGTHVADGILISDKSQSILAGGNLPQRSAKKSHKKWTPRERYLLVICAVLFVSCIAFIFIAFLRDKIIANTWPCKGETIM